MLANTCRTHSPEYPGYVSVLELVPIEERQLEVRQAARLELSRTGHAVLAAVASIAMLVAPVVLPPAATVFDILAGVVGRAPWEEIVPTRPIGVGESWH